MTIRNLFTIISLLFICLQFYGQTKIDSAAISFKAKLFTVSEYGLASKERILQDIEEQDLKFLPTKLKNFVFMKVSFSQPYRFNENGERSLFRNCSYYLAFNLTSLQFYRLGGFDNLDIDDFFDDCSFHGEILFSLEDDGDNVSGLNLLCMIKFLEMSKKERFRKGFRCSCNCRESLFTTITEY